MTTWDPALYQRFGGPRLRPALDLLHQIRLLAPELVVDLGCGDGAVVPFLRERWPRAELRGVDSSNEMLDRAREAHPGVEFVEADIAEWTPPRPVDLVYSNAALHWLDDHRALFPRIASWVRPGGVLAVQMPHNHKAPAYRIIDRVARDGPWAERLEPVLRPAPVADPGDYHEILAPSTAELDIWETEYLQVLEGENPVAAWTRGTFLRPLIGALNDAEPFLAEVAEAIADAYPPQPDGTTLFPFKRMFIVALV